MDEHHQRLPADSAPPSSESNWERLAQAFAPTTKLETLFEDADTTYRLNLLRHLLQSTDLVVLVTGSSGSGKSALLHQLEKGTDERWALCRLDADSEMTPRHALAKASRCFNLPTDCGEAGMEALLREQADQLTRAGKTPVLAVDDADRLPRETLERIAELSRPSEEYAHPWRLILVADPAIEALIHPLDGTALSDSHIQRIRPAPIPEDRVIDYLRHRLIETGADESEFPFTREQVTEFYRRSGGLPGRINELAQAALLKQAPGSKQPAAGQRPLRRPARRSRRGKGRRLLKLSGLAALAIVLGAVVVFQEHINALFQPPTEAPATAEPGYVVRAIPDLQPAPAPKPPGPDPQSRGADRQAGPDTSGAEEPPASLAASPSEPIDERPGIDPPTPQPSERVEPETPRETSTAEPTPPTQDRPQKVPEATPPPLAASPEPEATSTPATPPQPKATAAAPASEPTEETPESPWQGKVLQGRAWLEEADAGRFTFQLAGSREAETALDLVRRHGLSEKTAVYRVSYKDAPWFVVVHGDFANRRAANRAIASLPDALRDNGPWVRPIRAVQQELRQGHK